MGDGPAGGTGSLFAQRIERGDIPKLSRVVELEAHWNSLLCSDGLPSRRDIDSVEIGGALLPWLFLLDFIREDKRLDYLYRLAGTINVELVGRDPTDGGQARYSLMMSTRSSLKRLIRR